MKLCVVSDKHNFPGTACAGKANWILCDEFNSFEITSHTVCVVRQTETSSTVLFSYFGFFSHSLNKYASCCFYEWHVRCSAAAPLLLRCLFKIVGAYFCCRFCHLSFQTLTHHYSQGYFLYCHCKQKHSSDFLCNQMSFAIYNSFCYSLLYFFFIVIRAATIRGQGGTTKQDFGFDKSVKVCFRRC